MPRNGDGISDNGPFEEAKHDILHGVGPKESGEVARAKNTAAMPEHDKGDAVPGLNGSGGGHSLPTTGNDGKGSVA